MAVTVPVDECRSGVDELTACCAVNRYLAANVCVAFYGAKAVFIEGSQPRWRFSIEYRMPELGNIGVMGMIEVDAKTGQVFALDETKIEFLLDQASDLLIQQKAASPHREEPHCIAPVPSSPIDKQTARFIADKYLHSAIGEHYFSRLGTYLPTHHPVWLFDIHHRHCDDAVGLLSVNACSGQVIALDPKQLQEIQMRPTHVAAPPAFFTETAS